MHARTTRVLALALLSSACGLVVGATKSATFNVGASVASGCFINSASTMAFGNYTQGAGNIDQTSTIAVRCSNTTSYGIGLNAGTGAGSSFAQRTMTSATVAGTLQYNLFTNAGHTTIWRNPGAPGAVPINQGGVGTGLGNVINHTVYGRLQDTATSRAAAPAADYISTITVTINY
jgi:spore coat protein U-like protein